MKSHKTTFCFLGLLSMSTTLALAQEDSPKGRPPGAPGDGSRLAEFMKRADTNSDGKISKEEFKALPRGGGDERFAKMDANADGFVDEAEMKAAAAKMGDGMRDKGKGDRKGGEGGFRRPPGDEAPGAGGAEGSRPGPPEGGRRPEGGPPRGPGGPDGAAMMDEMFTRMDKNADGVVEKEEHLDFSKQEIETRFSRMDGNTDGKLTKEEMKAGMERSRGMRGPGGPGGPGRGPGGPGAPDGGPRRGGPEGGEGGFRRPPTQEGDTGSPRPEFEKKEEAEKKDAI